jgi:hypothetical protein
VLFKVLTNDYRNSCQANLSLLEEKEEFDTESKALRVEIENLHQQKLEINLQLVEKYCFINKNSFSSKFIF